MDWRDCRFEQDRVLFESIDVKNPFPAFKSSEFALLLGEIGSGAISDSDLMEKKRNEESRRRQIQMEGENNECIYREEK